MTPQDDQAWALVRLIYSRVDQDGTLEDYELRRCVDDCIAAFAAVRQAAQQAERERLLTYTARRIEMAGVLLASEKLSGNVVKEEREKAAIAELHGIELFLRDTTTTLPHGGGASEVGRIAGSLQ